MSINSIEFPVGLSDAEILRYERFGDRFCVSIKAWNETGLKLYFDGVLGICDFGMATLGNLVYGHKEESLFFRNTLEREYVAPVPETSHNLFVFIDSDDQPFIEIVAEAVRYEVE